MPHFELIQTAYRIFRPALTSNSSFNPGPKPPQQTKTKPKAPVDTKIALEFYTKALFGVALRLHMTILRAMYSLNRYIISQLIGPGLLITFTLTGIVWLTQSLQFVEKLINGLPVSTFLLFTVLILPGILKYTLLLGFFFAAIFTANKLYSESEIVVMWSAGLSKMALTKPFLYVSITICILLYAISMYLSPYGLRKVFELRVEWRDSLAAVVLREGVFNSLSRGVTVYIREKLSTGELLGILVHDERNPAQPVTYMAERGAFVKTDSGPRFVMRNGNLQEVKKGEARLSLLYFEQYTLDVSQFEKKSRSRWLEPKYRYPHELLFPEQSKQSIRNADRLKIEMHERLVMPLYAITLSLIAIAGVFYGDFSRRGKAKVLAATSVAGVVLVATSISLFKTLQDVNWIIPILYILPLLAGAAAINILSGNRLLSRQEPKLQQEGPSS